MRMRMCGPLAILCAVAMAGCGGGSTGRADPAGGGDAAQDAVEVIAADAGGDGQEADAAETVDDAGPGPDTATDPGTPRDVADTDDATIPADTPDVTDATDIATDVPADTADATDVVTPPPAIVWGKCNTSHFAPGYPTPSSGLQCGTLTLPVDAADPAGPTVKLQVGRMAATQTPSGKAIFFIQGGPGGDSLELAVVAEYYFQQLNETVDLLFVDQRGTGGSDYLDCKGGYPETKAEWLACATKLAAKPLDHYLTLDAAHDLDRVRDALGYEKVGVWGGSYGTRVALEYLRQHPDRAEATVLDGVVPVDADFEGSIITAVDDGIQKLLADCDADPACKAVSPTLEADLLARRAALKAKPRPIMVGGYAYSEDDTVYVQVLGAALAYWETRYRIPRAVHDAVNGDNSAWNEVIGAIFGTWVYDYAIDRNTTPAPLRLPFIRRFAAGDVGISPGLYMTSFCAEFLPNSPGREAAQAMFNQQVWADPQAMDMFDICDAWPVEPIDATLRTPVASDGHVLLMSGDNDIQTFPAWGDHAAETLPAATHLLVPVLTHGVMQDECARSIQVQFLTGQTLDPSCLAQIEAPSW
jgi:pimeloyl-ACP methyl ester carboxylesterase